MKRLIGSLLIGTAALLLGPVLTPSLSAFAQGAFYAEVKKEGRIHVFNDAKRYDAFMKTGEMGPSITRAGAGPNGETLVFDSVAAIHLYNFKHDLPPEVIVPPEEAEPGLRIEWKDGKTTIETDRASLVLSNRVQVRFTYEDPEDPAGDSKGSFRIRRAKTKFSGWIYTKDLTYELQLNWPDTSNELEDANIAYDVTRGRELFQLKAGQFKVPFGRQELTSSGAQQFVDRSIVSNEFAKGRDIGLQVSGSPLEGKLDWRLGLFNGNGRTKSSNDNSRYQTNARVTWQPWGDVKYSESDFESKERPLFAVAANYERNDMRGATAGNDLDREILGADAVFKYYGISVLAEYFDRETTDESDLVTDADGLTLQAGAFVWKRNLEIALRYAAWDPDRDLGGNDRTEKGLAVNWFWNRHNLKLQADYRILEDETRPREADETREARLQMQFVF